jgi:hypothetical protein
VLHAEAFSYSIAPLLEARDVDRLATQPDADGHLRIEVRNEALETLLPPGLARMPFRTVRSASFSDVLGPRQITDGGTDSERRSLARFSRYPFGLSDAQLSDLLEALGQSELIEVGR